MRKLIATLFAAICLITAFGQVDSLKNASLIGQASRNQKVGQGFQIGFVGSSDDTCQINTKLQIVPNAGLGKLLYSDANGFGTWSRDILIGANDIRIASSDGLIIGINDSLGTRNAFMQYQDDTTIHRFTVNQFGAFIQHEYRSQPGHYDGLLSIVHYENSLNRAPGDGRILAISNTNDINVMSITDTATGNEISKFENTDSVAKVLVNYNAEVQFKSDAVLGVYSDSQKWRIDSNGVAYLEGISITDGTQGTGKVLTSDANGNATWQDRIESGAFTNLTTYLDTNVTSATACNGQWSRVDSLVTFSFRITIQTTTNGVYQVSVALPYNSNFTDDWDCIGVGASAEHNENGMYVHADTVNDRISIHGDDNDTSPHYHYITGSYVVK